MNTTALPEGMTESWTRASRTLGGRLRYYREHRDMTREDLAHIVRRSGSTVLRWESGQQLPSVEMLRKVSTALRTPLVQLLPPDERAPLVQVDEAGHREDVGHPAEQTSLLEDV